VSNVELLSGWGTFKLLAIEVVNSFLGAFWSILLVDTLWVIVADECDLANLVLHQVKRLDFSVSLEHFLDLVLWVVHWNVLDIDIVDELSDMSSIFWLKFHSNSIIVLLGSFDSFGGSSFIVEADETIASGGVV